MTLVIPAGYGQVAYRFSLAEDPEVMVTTIGVDVDFGATGPQDKLDQKRDAFVAATAASSMNAGWTFLGCRMNAGNASGPPTIYESPATVVGTGAGQSPPNNCAVLVKKGSALGGRQHRGRMFVPPMLITEGNISNTGILAGSALTDWQTWVGAAFPGDDWVILHSDVPTPVPAPTPVTSLVVDRQIATQRRRMRN